MKDFDSGVANAYLYSQQAEAIMRRGSIVRGGWDGRALIEALLARLFEVEARFATPPKEAASFIREFRGYLDRGLCILGTPLLTNIAAARPTWSSCTAVPTTAVDGIGGLCSMAESYYALNMGSGFNLNGHVNPVGALLALNEHAAKVQAGGTCERYVGNIAHLPIDHPHIIDFIRAKADHCGLVHFNISVELSDAFMAALESGADFELANGRRIAPQRIWDELIHCAWATGDPGILSLARFNACNPIAEQAPYVTTAPCAEVGLAEGDTCTFGYINLLACLTGARGALSLDVGLLARVTSCLTRVLDDAVEASIAGLPTKDSQAAVGGNRRIGLSLCGFADALAWLGLEYGDPAGIDLLQIALDTVNYHSKRRSWALARMRGPFLKFDRSAYRDPAFLARFAAAAPGSNDWPSLAVQVARDGIRNATTTALPPSGRSALLLGVNPSIEPLLDRSIQLLSPCLRQCAVDHGLDPIALAREALPTSPAGRLFRAAEEVPWQDHLAMAAAASPLIDEGISKTVNLPIGAGHGDVDAVFRGAWRRGLKAISVYRPVHRSARAMSVASKSEAFPPSFSSMKDPLYVGT